MEDVYFARLSFGRLHLETALEHYVEWLLGFGEFSRIRERRLSLGVMPDWTAKALFEGGQFQGTSGCRIEIRREDESARLQFVHGDDTNAAIEWHSVAELTRTGDRTLLAHGAGRLVPKDAVLEPVAAAPAVLTALLERSDLDVEPAELRAMAPLTYSEGGISSFVSGRLLSRERGAPIALVTPTDRGDSIVDPLRLARALRGVATVACLADAAVVASLERELDRRGLETALFCPLGAARLYHLDLKAGAKPEGHPVWTSAQVLRFPPRRRTTALAAEMIGDVSRRTLPRWFFG